jgi:hypothetical protein
MLITALAVWLAFLLFAFALCRRAAHADSQDVALIVRYLSDPATERYPCPDVARSPVSGGEISKTSGATAS